MALRSFRSLRLAPLLALLLLQDQAAARQPVEIAYRDVRAAADRADWNAVASKLDAVFERFEFTEDSPWLWEFRALQGELLFKKRRTAELRRILAADPPPKLQTSAANVQRLILLAAASDGSARQRFLESAYTIAARHQPAKLADVLLARANFQPQNFEADVREALRIAQRHRDRRTHVKALATLSYRLVSEERYVEAVRWGEEARAMAGEFPYYANIIDVNLGWAYHELGDYVTAADYFERSEAVARTNGADRERIDALNQLGNLAFLRSEYAKAERSYRAVVDIGDAKGDTVGYARANLARVAIATGRFDEARAHNAAALELKRAANDAAGIERSQIIDARIHAATGRHAEAEALLREVIRSTNDTATRWEAHGRLAQLYVLMQQDELAAKEFERAQEIVSEARAAIDDRELRLAFFNSFSEIFGAYLDFLVATRGAEAALQATENQRAEAMEDDLGVAATRNRVAPRELARQLGATILSYWLGPERSYLWTITGDDVRIAALPAQSRIEDEVDAYLRTFRGPAGTLERSGGRGQRLFARLVAPAGTIAPGSRVIIVPDGRLHALNFETLVTPEHRYWIADAVITVASSLQLLARDERPAGGKPSLLLVGDPIVADPAFPALGNAPSEIAHVARHFSSPTILARANATPAAYRDAKPESFDYVHFVAHGISTRRKPLDSAVILGRDGRGDDYKLMAREIVQRPLGARLVTISSCFGAGSATYAGEGLVGLAWAFQRAGADRVIAALWEVSDQATPMLMNDLYARIRAGSDPAVALREAKLALIRGGRYARPHYWAPFVLYGSS